MMHTRSLTETLTGIQPSARMVNIREMELSAFQRDTVYAVNELHSGVALLMVQFARLSAAVAWLSENRECSLDDWDRFTQVKDKMEGSI
jgi:hypothetical protein